MFSKTPGKLLKALILSLALLMILLAGVSCGKQAETNVTEATPQDTLYQVSTLGALNVGVFEGAVDYATIERHGDCGIGSFLGLDGEMVALDGKFYQVRTDGVPVEVNVAQTAPYAMVTFFQADLTGNPPAGLDYAGLQQFAGTMLPTPNYFYAVRVEGEFAYLKIRSVPGQQPPYPTLTQVVAEQTVWEKENIRGTMIGFFSPAYVGSVDPAGYHLHFISEDGKSGGHVLDCRTGAVALKLDETADLDLVLPAGTGFQRADLAPK
jgi:acetolactate decarboxylase